MTMHDLVVRGGTVVTAEDVVRCDVGIVGGRIATLGDGLEGRDTIDASGRLVLPGGVDSHCHIEQLEPDGSIHEETFESAGTSALAGGTTTVIPFAPQFKGEPIAKDGFIELSDDVPGLGLEIDEAALARFKVIG